MNSSNGILTLNASLDRETCSQYSYTVRATDLIDQRLSSFLTLNIHVNDVNDNGPRFEQNSYVFKIAENSQGNASIRLNVTDADELKSELSFNMESDEELDIDLGEYFELQSDEEDVDMAVFLIIKKQLDYEKKRMHRFRLFVSDEKHMADIANIEVELNQFDIISENNIRIE